MAELTPLAADKRILADAVPALVPHGARLGLGGGPLSSTPTALVRALIRAGARNLDLVAAATGGYGLDLLIGAGCARSVEFAQVVLNEFGPAPAFRRHAESGALVCLDHT